MAEVTRLDFASAGTLLNILAPHRQRSIAITLRYPNHLVAELLGLMGVDDTATIVYSKR
jgi:ABC-type transporter Mla MlaB component